MHSETLYADALLEAGANLPMPDDHEDRGLYVLHGEVIVSGQTFEAGRMLVFRPGEKILAKEAWRAGDWAHGRFKLPPGDDAAHVPAPDR